MPRTKQPPKLARGEGSWNRNDARGCWELWFPTVDASGARKRAVVRSTLDGVDAWRDCIAKRDARWEVDADRATLTNGGRSTVAQVVDDWLEHDGRGMAQTLDAQQWAAEHIKRELGATKPFAEVRVADIEDMLRRLIDVQRFRPTAVRKLCTVLAPVMAFGVRREYRKDNPLLDVVMPKNPHGPLRRRDEKAYNVEEHGAVVRHLLAEPGAMNSALLVQLQTGLRPGELLGLMWENVHLDVERPYLRVDTSQHRDRLNRLGHGTYYTDHVLKTDRAHDPDSFYGHRDVPLTAEAIRVLRRERQAQLAEGRRGLVTLIDTGEAMHPVFTAPDGLQFTDNGLLKAARRIAGLAGVRPLNPNGYRHTFASLCRLRLMQYELLAKLMGHKDASQIIETYGHPLTDPVRVDLDRFVGLGA